ncbi:thiamine pyrophosphate-dependent enzyme [Azospirillum sp. SYSU D00513]|uniref:thiamine pyrophosphate-dependent enzyme n=1 Tax=Azospirillum sp. SYSU D00513 TaxID=2812561 RepID=UPI001A9753A7|nr:thiamine pyrophosphate-dependent enzyme [Azospirillum sp. SYSU D00513]
MAQNTSDILIETLIEWGVDTVFGMPGDGINGIMEALRTRQDRIRFVQARHEEAAAFMACAYAKWSGKLGCCLATTGPGGVHLLNGLYDAKFDRAPVIAITGLPYQDLNQTYTQQDIDHTRLFTDATAYSAQIFSAAHVQNAVSLACRTALSNRAATHVAVPADVQEQSVEEAQFSPRNKPGHTSTAYVESAREPTEDAIARAAEVLNAGKKVMILAGQGAFGAGDELLRTAELLGAPIAKALLGKAVLPDGHPHVTGGVGYLGTRPSQLGLEECDTLLIVGSSFPYIEYYPKPGQARAVQIDLDPTRISLRYPAEAAVVGDVAKSLRALNEKLQRKSDRTFLERVQAAKAEWLRSLEEGADRPGEPMKPQRVVRDLDRRLADDAIIVTDCGHNTGLAAQYVTIRGTQKFGVSGTLASMGAGVPYAIAAALAFPGRQVVACVGDGGLAMSLGELATCRRYGLPVKVIVINNSTLGQIKWEQMMFLGNPEFGCDLQPIDFAKVAEGLGLKGYRIERSEDCAAILDRAFAEPGPVLVDAVVDQWEPMLPPKRREEYMKHLQQALDAGTPGREQIERALSEEPARTAVKE